jgi:hypothetical protein
MSTPVAEAMRGLTLDVVTPADGRDYSNSGLSTQVRRLTLVGWTGYASPTEQRTHGRIDHLVPLAADAQVRAPSGDAPAVCLHLRRIGFEISPALIPCTTEDNGYRPEFGSMADGAFAHSSDQRLAELMVDVLGHPFYGAIALHDRWE